MKVNAMVKETLNSVYDNLKGQTTNPFIGTLMVVPIKRSLVKTIAAGQMKEFSMRIILTLAFITVLSVSSFSQTVRRTKTEIQTQDKTYTYVYILIEGKLFSKKLKVDVDFGDTPEQLKAGKEYSEKLTNKKSYAAVLNYMVESQFELVQTLDYNYSYSGSGGTSGIVFIMRKTKAAGRVMSE
ncbi:hypothetical protein [Pedobacter immunditicola]|uniref:hypothetical protein n=1 Tax=Pedobacter immunditicola TaxID=3133440 RepID=UPI003094E9CC